jgi:branched-subunit amino acid aminotransferase/4-amino-4-deoxychorismate lyase
MAAEPVWRAFGPDAAASSDPGFEAPAPRTALRLEAGRAEHAEAHLRRLRDGCAVLGLHAPWLAAAFAEALALHGDGLLRLRVDPARAALWARLEPFAALPAPYRLLPRPHPLGDARGESFAPHKGLMGPWSAAALAEARAAGADDLLCLWPDGTVAETAIASVALHLDAALRLPPPEGRVASLAEALDLPDWAAARGLEICTAPITLPECARGTLLCFNAARGVWQAEILPLAP